MAHLRIGAAGGTGLEAHQLALLHLGVGRPAHKLGLHILAAVITGVICCWKGNLLLFPVGVMMKTPLQTHLQTPSHPKVQISQNYAPSMIYFSFIECITLAMTWITL